MVVGTIPLEHYKRTKIIATIGPSSDSYDCIFDIIKNGANGLRLNFSHGTHEEHAQQVKWIRKAAKELGKPVSIIQDLQGPKLRLGDFDGIVTVQKGQSICFAHKITYQENGPVPTQYDLSKKVKRGERMFIYDGKVRLTVASVKNGIVYCRAENDGILIKRKGINLPDTDFSGDILTTKDRKDLVFGSTHDFDYVALSFVQSSADVAEARRLLKNLGFSAKLITKIETRAAVDNIEDIIQVSDAVMIARGDLAVETPPESVPIVQRQIIGLGMKYSVPTIVATQMLYSMTELPDPTRAEVSDVATAVLVGADAVMLSDETASGRYPVESVSTMKRVITYTEQHSPLRVVFPDRDPHTRQSAISQAIIKLAQNIEARAIVAETKSGATARQIASWRASSPIIAVTNEARTAQQLAIIYNVKSYVRPIDPFAAQKLTNWLKEYKILHKGDVVVTVSGKYPGVVGTTDTIKVRVLD